MKGKGEGGRAHCPQRAAQAALHLTSKEAQERKNTSLDALSEGASDGPSNETSKEAKLHGRQCPLQCVS
jgi:hypothetical protein